LKTVTRSELAKIFGWLLLIGIFAGSAGCSDNADDATEDAAGDGGTDRRGVVGDGTVDDSTGRDTSIVEASMGDAMSGDAAVRGSDVRDTSVGDVPIGDAALDEPAVDATAGDGTAEDRTSSDATSSDGRDSDAAGADSDAGDGSNGDTAGGADSDAAGDDSAVRDVTGGDAGTEDTRAGDAASDATDADGTSWATRASVSLHMQEYDPMHPDYGMYHCPPSRHWMNVPYDRARSPTGQPQQVDDTAALFWAAHGENGDSVACTVRANGAAFAVTAEATGYAEFDGLQRRPTVVHIRIPSIVTGDSSAPGSVSFQDDASLVTYSSSQCVFSIQGGSLAVTPGRIWASVRCENLANPTQPDAACQMDVGYFVFENCSQ
jgi:hypothetical protein